MKLKSFVMLLVVLAIAPMNAQQKKKRKKPNYENYDINDKWYIAPERLRIPANLKQTPDSEVRLERWFNDAKYGAFIHFGAYSSLGGEYKGRIPRHPYSEWIMMTAHIPAKEYRKEVAAKFNPAEFDAEEWAKTFKDAGLKYVVITSKHHEGFALFDSDVSDYNIVDYTDFKRDIVKELAEACQRHGIHFGVYYSHAQDWDEPHAMCWDGPYHVKISDGDPLGKIHPYLPADFKQNHDIYFKQKSLAQVEELVKNYPIDVFWFDTPAGISEAHAKQFSEIVRKYRPNCVINSRLIQRPRAIQKQEYQKYFDYLSLIDKQVPKDGLPVPFDTPDSVTHSYGYKDKGSVKYHSLTQLIRRFVNTICSGGSYLLNSGPMGNGKLDPKAVELYKGIGDWLKINGESIYNTRKNPFKKPQWGNISVSKNGSVYYLHILSWPKDNKITLAGFDKKVKKATFLANSKKVKTSQENSTLSVLLPKKPSEFHDIVVKLVAK